MTVSKHIPALAGGLALAIALLLAPEAARAQSSSYGSCGTVTGGHHHGTHECDAMEAAGGVAYWTGGSGGTTTALTLTVPGAATTVSITTIAPTLESGHAYRESGIVLVGPGTASRSLTVGATGPVAITQRSGVSYTGAVPNDSGSGIVVYPNTGSLTGSLTIDLRSGVTIGTEATPMLNDGIWLNSNSGTNMAAHSVTSGARIWATNDGIRASTLGTGKVTIENTGAIDANRGIALYTDAANTGGAEITNLGAITAKVSTRTIVGNGGGIHLQQAGTGASTITNRGTIAADSSGIRLLHTGASGDISVTNRGAVTAGSRGIWIHHQGTGAGSVSLINSGDIKTTGRREDGGEYPGTGILIRKASTGDLTFENTGDIESDARSIILAHDGTSGDITVTNSGSLTGRIAHMWILNRSGGTSGAVSVTNSGDITGLSHAIHAETAKAAGAVSVTHSAGDIAVTGRGIHAQNTAGNADDVTVKVTGGSVASSGRNSAVVRTPAVEVIQLGTGSAIFDLASGAALTSKHNAGVIAALGNDADNAAGQVRITQAGTITARTGVDARVLRTSAAGETRTANRQPLIDITWTGTFSHGTTATVAPNDDDRFNIRGDDPANVRWVFTNPDLREPVGYPYTAADSSYLEAQVRGVTRYGAPAGIDALVMSWREVAEEVSKGDDPDAFADAAAVTALFDDGADAATQARAAAIVSIFRAALTHPEFEASRALPAIDTDGMTGLSDAEIVAYLSKDSDVHRGLLRDVLAQSLSEKEEAVLEAVATGGDVDAALDDASFSDDYKTAVKALLERHNVGDVRVAMNAGSIASRGDGIRAWFAQQHDDNGAIAVTVAEGATVTGGAAGVYVSGAGTGLRVEKKYTSREVQEAEANRDLGADALVSFPDYLDQVVRVQGTVTGGTDAAVHLDGGGALIVTGAGKLVAGPSGRAVLVNDPGPAVIYIDGAVTGGAGPEGAPAPAAVDLTGGGSVIVGRNGSVSAGGAASAIRGGGADAPTTVMVHSDGTQRDFARRVVGPIRGVEELTVVEVLDDGTTGYEQDLPLKEDGTVDISELLPSCDAVMDVRCHLYEALPSILLAMNGLPTRAERASAARDGSGGWVRIEGGGGKWTAERSASSGPKLSFDHSRYGVRAGADAAVGENGRLGASVHGFRGDAKVSSSGTAKLSGVGVGVHATAMLGGFHVDAQAATTWYDVDLKSSMHATPLKADVKGRGHAAGVEVGRRAPVTDEVSVTPRAGVVWSEVSLNDFTDGIGRGAEVSVEEGESLTGRAGLSVESEASEGVRLFGTLDVTHEFSEETEVAVSGTPLKASAEKTGVRFGVGGTFALGHGASLQGTAGYALTGGSGNRAYGGGLSVTMSF